MYGLPVIRAHPKKDPAKGVFKGSKGLLCYRLPDMPPPSPSCVSIEIRKAFRSV
jgi:hypothetical protein